jgi:FAD:protein FMN transferase
MAPPSPTTSDGTLPARPPRPLTRREMLTLRRDSGDRADGHWIRVHRAAMACRFEVLLDEEDAAQVAAAREALDLADSIEADLTVFRETSEIVRVNRTAHEGATVDAELFALLTLSRALHDQTEGAFDITSTPLSRTWGFLRRDGQVPSDAAIGEARARVGMTSVELEATSRTVRFRRAGMELNLGSIGKGYALDRMAAAMRARGTSHALLSAGGSSAVAVGGRGAGFSVDIRSRQVKTPRLASLRLRDGALATSGAGEQFFVADGRRYGHVIDPRTGWPAQGVTSVSVVTERAAVADALSTAFLIGGLELARRYCAAHPDTLVLVTPDDGTEHPVVVGAYPGARVEET